MNSLWVIACGIGLQDALNPCIFMTCAVFIVLRDWFKENSLRSGRLSIIFALTYAISFLAFNFGPAQIYVFRKEFIFAAKILYSVLSAGTFILAVLYLKDWFLIRRGIQPKEPAGENVKPFAGKDLTAALITVILAVVFCALSTLWPINNYICLLGNESLLKGQWQSVMPLLLGYVLASMWPLWFVWSFLSIKNIQPSLLKIFYAAIFLTASTNAILIFK